MKSQPIRVEKSLHEELLGISNATRPRVGVQALTEEAIRRLIEDVRAHGLDVLREGGPAPEPVAQPATSRYKIERNRKTQ